jgi:virulence-associated protein VagC
VSDVWLRRCCVGANIPTPDRGHWVKLRAGKQVVRIPLPPRAPGQSDHVSVIRSCHVNSIKPQSGAWDRFNHTAAVAAAHV